MLQTSLKLILIICFKALKPHSPFSFPSSSKTCQDMKAMNIVVTNLVYSKLCITRSQVDQPKNLSDMK